MLAKLFGWKKDVQSEQGLIRVSPVNNTQRVIGLLNLNSLSDSAFQARLKRLSDETRKLTVQERSVNIPRIIDDVFLSFQYDPKYLKFYLKFINQVKVDQLSSSAPINLILDEDEFPTEEMDDVDFSFLQKAAVMGKDKMLESINDDLHHGYNYSYEYFKKYFSEKNCTPFDINFDRLFDEIVADKNLTGLRFGQTPEELKEVVFEIHKIQSKTNVPLIGYDISVFLTNVTEAFRINLLNENNLFDYAGQVIPYVKKYFRNWNEYCDSYLVGKASAEEVSQEDLIRIKEISENIVRPIAAEDMNRFLTQ